MIVNDVPEPDVPLHGPWLEIRDWLEGLPPGSPTPDDVLWSPVLSDQSFEPGEDEIRDSHPAGMHISWLGGPAAGPLPSWPRRTDGRPLAHVVTVSLADVDGTIDDQAKSTWPGLREGLPTTGVLEVFHDLESFGTDPGEGVGGEWLVRWVPEPDGTLLDGPPDLHTPTQICHGLITVPGFTLPPAGDAVGTEDFEAIENAERALQRAWLQHRTGADEREPIPMNHVYGHPHKNTWFSREVLAQALPLTRTGDEYRLILDLESWTHLDQWFGDAGNLEVWMRDSDLQARDFSRARCLIRTD